MPRQLIIPLAHLVISAPFLYLGKGNYYIAAAILLSLRYCGWRYRQRVVMIDNKVNVI